MCEVWSYRLWCTQCVAETWDTILQKRVVGYKDIWIATNRIFARLLSELKFTTQLRFAHIKHASLYATLVYFCYCNSLSSFLNFHLFLKFILHIDDNSSMYYSKCLIFSIIKTIYLYIYWYCKSIPRCADNKHIPVFSQFICEVDFTFKKLILGWFYCAKLCKT